MNTYLISSETIYYLEKSLKEIIGDNSNIVTYNLDEDSIDDVLNECSYLSLFTLDKCVIAKNANFFSTSKTGDSKKNTEIINKIFKYLESENPHTKLIFILNGNADNKKKLYQKIKENNHLYVSPPMTKTTIKNELLKICKMNKYTISDKALWYIINNSLDNFDLAYNELKKIMLYYNKPSQIKDDVVTALTCETVSENNFKLVDSIMARDLATSLELLKTAVRLKVEPTVIISLIYREFKLMLMVVIYKENNYKDEEILSNLHLPEWRYEKVNNNLRKYHSSEIKSEIITLSDLDYQLKSGYLDKDVALISYIVNLCL